MKLSYLLPYDQYYETDLSRIHGPRNRFERDIDRILYSSAWRRLKSKTQVYPLQGLAQVHDRLTHSLEVSTVCRSFGRMFGEHLKKISKDDINEYSYFLKEKCPKLENFDISYYISCILQAAALAHDIGNPPFGHAGEKAIQSFYENIISLDKFPFNELSEEQKSDFINFDGNANAIRVLAKPRTKKKRFGYIISYPVLSTIIKYPYPSIDSQKKGKFGFFKSEEELVININKCLNIPLQGDSGRNFERNPLTCFLEAADDIVNIVIDLQDGVHFGLVNSDDIETLLLGILESLNSQRLEEIKAVIKYIDEDEKRERINFLRGYVVNELTLNCFNRAVLNINRLKDPRFSLLDNLKESNKEINDQLDECDGYRKDKLFDSHKVLQLEVAGKRIIDDLLQRYTDAVIDYINDDDSNTAAGDFSKKLIKLMPKQFMREIENKNIYESLMSVVDFISNMTDDYALDFHKKITGQRVPSYY